RRAEHQQAQHHQRGRDRPADVGLGDVHGGGPLQPDLLAAGGDGGAEVAGAVSILTLAPSLSRYCPSTTTWSPAAMPLGMMARPSCMASTSAGRRWTGLPGCKMEGELPAGPCNTARWGTVTGPLCPSTMGRTLANSPGPRRLSRFSKVPFSRNV